MPPKKEAKKEEKKDDKKKDDKKKDDKKKDDKKGDAKKDDKKADEKPGGDKGGKGGKGGKGKGKAKAGGDAEAADAAAPKKKKDDEGPAFKKDEEEEIPAGSKRRLRKERYSDKLRKFLHQYKHCLVCTVDFVGSNQMQQVRIALRGKAEIIMGKNTVIRKIVREEGVRNSKLLNLLPLVQGNVGFAFTNGSLPEIRKIIQANKVPAAAKSGVSAPDDVFVPAGPTGLDPGQTSFFQALNIATKIARGSIEIINRVHLVKKGERVNSSHVGLLAKLDLKPFTYGILVTHAYENGAVYESKILDVSMDDVMVKWLRGVAFVAALSLSTGHPTEASIAHSIVNGFRKLAAIALEINYDFDQLTQIKERLANPDKFAEKEEEGGEEAEEAEAEEEEEEEEEESDGQLGGGMFGGED
jgi:large subunit ribosomal protein LP0